MGLAVQIVGSSHGALLPRRDGDQTVEIGQRKRPHQESLGEAVDSGIHANAESQSQHRDKGKAGVLEQHANAVTDVLQKRFEKRQGAEITNHFFGLLDAAEFDQGLPLGFCAAHAGVEIVFDVQLEMAVHFG